MSYPNYGGGYPPQQPVGYPPAPGGFQGAPGYPAGGGYPPAPGGGMPTPESASAAAYGSAPGLPYAPQPGGPSGPGNIGFNTGAPMPSGPPMPGMPPGPGYPQAMPGGPAPQQGYPPQPGYPQAPQPGYNPAPPGGYGAPPYGQPQGGAPPPQQPPYGAPQQGYNPAPPPSNYAPPAGGSYGAPPAGGYGAPPAAQPYGGYGTGGQQQTGYTSTPAAAQQLPREDGTLKPYRNFNAEQDCQHLRKAMKGFGTDEKAIIDILGYRSNDQRMNLKVMYKTCFGRDLVNDLRSELGGRFEDAILALMMNATDFDAFELRNAMSGAGTNEATLIEILCTRSNAQIKAIHQAYKTMYKNDLEKAIVSETSGHFRKLMVSMCAGGRQENQAVDMNKAQADAQKLYQAGVKRWGTDENTFNMVLASQSHQQCKAVFDAYAKIAGHDIETAIKREMSGDLETGMLTIVRVIRNKHEYFSDCLYHSMKGLGTKDRALIRVIVSRCEVDMKQIKMEFQRKYGKGLESFVRDDVSGDYRKLLLALITDH